LHDGHAACANATCFVKRKISIFYAIIDAFGIGHVLMAFAALECAFAGMYACQESRAEGTAIEPTWQGGEGTVE
jgi:hypothetical protein